MAIKTAPSQDVASAKSSPRRKLQKNSRLSIRASEPQKSILEQAAKLRHMNMSQFVLQASLDAAQNILTDQTIFKLSPEKWAEFCSRLDEPPREKPELKKLLNRPEP
jgi:uncharacterized protein (DUF1778 family)